MASFAEYTNNQKKKKKQQSAAGMSFTDYTKSVLGKDDIETPLSQRNDTEDIAPVKETKSEKRTWFQSGRFVDGYDFGDISKSLIGTVGDVYNDVSAGALGIIEGAIDAGAYLTGGVGKLFGADKFADKTKEFVKKDLIDENKLAEVLFDITALAPVPTAPLAMQNVKSKITEYILHGTPPEEATLLFNEGNSLLGEKTDALAQSGGQLLGTVGLQAMGVPWFVTTGVTSFGSATEEAFNEGADYGETGLSATIQAGADILTEKLFGGSGLGEKGLIPIEKFTKGISNKAVKLVADYVVDIGSEGFEEVAASLITRLGNVLTYEKEDTWKELLTNEEAMDNYIKQVLNTLIGKEARSEYLEAGIGGMFLGGGMNAGKVGKSLNYKKETKKFDIKDYRTGLTENEQKVFDKVYENALAEAETDGKKLTQKEKSKLYDEVMNDLEKGYISTDTIEEVLGGDSYKAYNDAVTNEETLQKEFDTLNKMKQGEMTGEQLDRRTELKQQLEELKTNSNKDNLKTKLSDEVFGLSQGSKLVESYNEKSRRGMAFEADLSQYDVKYQPTIKKAVESGILNNSNRTREFVEMVAKISADKGIGFDFSNNEKIAKSSFAVEGAIVNGFATKDGITVNVQSPKYLNTVVGHEITHILEGTELYNTLQKSIIEYAKSKGDYQGRIDTLKKLYKAEEIDAELTADLVGDYLFTDKDFIRKLSTENRNIFEKIYDEIKYLCKVATAGSKEARELEKVKKAFEDAYRGNVKTESKAVKHSLSTDSKGTKLSKEQQDYFKDSKAVDDNGSLQVVYHGTRKADFTVFKRNISYFTDSKEMADSYSPNGEMYEGYVNITKPYELDAKGEKWSKIPIDEATKKFLDEYGASTFKEGGKWRTTPADIASAIEEAVENGDLDYDGIIIKNIDDTGSYYKGEETHLATDYIVFNSNQFKNADNKKPTADRDIRYSLTENNDTYSRIYDMQTELGDLNRAIREIEENGEVDKLINEIFNSNDELEIKLEKYQQFLDESNYGKLKKQRDALQIELENLRKSFNEENANIELEKEKSAIAKSGLSEADYFRKQAVKEFGYTPYFYDAGYITPNGKMLNFSGEKGNHFGTRGQDHRAIGIIYATTEGTDALNRFVKDGNIRIMAESPAIDISTVVEPSKEQYATIRKFIYEYANKEYFCVDFTDESGKVIGSLEYENRINPTRILNDIKHYYATGEIREQSNVDKFRYSLSEADNTYLSAVEKGDTETAQRLVKETAKNSGYTIEAYHGTPNTEFTVFDRNRLGKGNDQYGAGFYFASNKEGASHYGNRVIDSALSIKNPIRITATSESGRNLIDADIELTSEQAYEIVKRHPDMYDEENSPLGDYFDSYWEDGAQDWMIESLAEQYRDVGYLDSDLFRNYPNELHEALRDVTGYDGVEVTFESTGDKFYVAWFDNQMKSVDPVTYDDNGDVIPLSQRFNADNNDIRYSLSAQGEAPTKHGTYNVSGKDIMLEDIAPTQPVAENTTVEEDAAIPEGFAPITEEEAIAQANESFESLTEADMPPQVEDEYYEATDTEALDEKTLRAVVKPVKDVLYLDPKDTKKLREIVQNYSTSENPNKADLYAEIEREFGEKSWREKNEEVAEVKRFLRDYKINVSDHIKGDFPNWAAYRKSIGARIKTSKEGLPVDTAYQELCEMFPNFFSDEDIINEADQFSRIVEVATMDTYNWRSQPIGDELIQKAVDIISSEIRAHKDNLLMQAAEETRMEELDSIAPPKAEQIVSGAEADARLVKDLDHYPMKTVEDRKATHIENLEMEVAANKQLQREAIVNYDKKIKQLTEEYIAKKDKDTKVANTIVQRIIRLETLKNGVEAQYAKRISDLEAKLNTAKAKKIPSDHIAEVMTEEPAVEKRKNRAWAKFTANFLDKGAVFEKLSLKNKNREIQAKYNMLHYADGRAQNLIGKGAKGVKALNDIRAEVEKTGLVKEFYDYLYHKHNVDRMSLEGKYEDAVNKPVFNEAVTAQVSQAKVNQYEFSNPQFVTLAKDVYGYMNYLREQLVDNGVISQETADLWAKMYPHYVPIRRLGDEGLNINVPLDTNKTSINAPIKRATGGSRDILPLFDTMALRTIQTYKAASKNSFGVELKNALGTTIEKAKTNLDEVIDSIDSHEELLQEGKDGKNPTFTVFDNGEKVTFEIDEDMYDALKPTSAGLAYINKAANTIGNLHRGVLTEYNPTFMLTNAVKDAQDVLINSQHPAKTYVNFPKAIAEIVTKGEWYNEYISNGGEQNTYFDKQTNTFEKEKSGISKVVGFPFEKISEANNFIEKIPRLAEYIASRKAGRSVDVSMLDAARVTTNFSAGGDVTKFLNRNGATFLNASVQGAMQQVRNIREAKANGIKGWLGLAGKAAVIGITPLLVNALLWDDDEDYEELSDYVKDNYYIVAKYGDGQFVRIPKGRTLAVIQNGFEQMKNAITGDDEVDFNRFFELFMNNIAPNNPIENNILAPVMQVAKNQTWYGDDLVPTRLQDLPQAEQYDESTDAISKWLGEKLNYSPYKINYLLNQYSGGLGDVLLPMITPEAERGDDTLLGNAIAPIKDKFSTDSVMKNQNISDFYNTVDELAVNANSSKATDEDVLKYKYINAVNAELSELYKAKREIQNSALSDAEKYAEVRAIQEQINNLARNGLNSYGNVTIDGNYATVGDRHFRWYEPSENSDAEAGWQKISDKQLEQQREATSYLGISEAEYWGNKEEYDYAYENPENYAVAKAVGGYNAYRAYISDLYDIKADKDENGKSISGSRKEKVLDYINALDADWYEKIILFKSQYNADDTYNYEIIDYLNSREDISYEEEVMILKQLGFEVDGNGNIYWD